MTRRLLLVLFIGTSLPFAWSAPTVRPVEPTDALGDPLPPYALLRIGTVRFRHGAGVVNVAVSPDGKSVFSAGREGAVRVWETATGKQRRSWRADDTSDMAYSDALFALSPDGKCFARHDSRTLRICDATSGKLLHTIATERGALTFLAFVGNTEVLYSCGGAFDEALRLVSVATGEERRSFPVPDERRFLVQTLDGNPGQIRAAVSRDGSLLLTARQSRAWLWDVGTGEKRCRMGGDVSLLSAVALSPDNRWYAWGDQYGELAIGKVSGETVQFVKVRQHGTITALAFSPDSRCLACGDEEGNLAVFAVESGERLHFIKAHGDDVKAVAFTPDGTALVTGGMDACVRVWDLQTGGEKVPTYPGGGVVRAALSPDGAYLAVTEDFRSILRCYETATAKEAWSARVADESNLPLVFSPDGCRLTAFTANGIRSWTTAAGQERRPIGYETWQSEVSADGRYALTVDQKGSTLAVVDTTTSRRLWQTTRPETVSDWLFSTDHQAVGIWWFVGRVPGEYGRPGAYRVYDAAGGAELFQCHLPEDEKPLLLSAAQGLLLTERSEFEDGKEWKRLGRLLLASGDSLPPFECQAGFNNTSATLTPDGRTLVTGDADGTIRLWELATGKARGTLSGHRGSVASLTFRSDGRRLASGSSDTTALVWDLDAAALGGPIPSKLTEQALDKLWADLRGDDAVVAYRAIHVLGAFPGESVPHLRARLRPAAVETSRVARLISDLDSPRFEVRGKASVELAGLAELAVPLLREVAKEPPSAEVRRRVQDLLEKAKTSPYLLTGERLRSWRALEALELCSTTEARNVLAAMAKGDANARLTGEAKRAMERLRDLAKR